MIAADPQQIASAAGAGVELLSNKDLPVPLGISIDGRLNVLLSVLRGVAAGELALVNVPARDVVDAQRQEQREEKRQQTAGRYLRKAAQAE